LHLLQCADEWHTGRRVTSSSGQWSSCFGLLAAHAIRFPVSCPSHADKESSQSTPNQSSIQTPPSYNHPNTNQSFIQAPTNHNHSNQQPMTIIQTPTSHSFKHQLVTIIQISNQSFIQTPTSHNHSNQQNTNQSQSFTDQQPHTPCHFALDIR
jgi:hypothetical protein